MSDFVEQPETPDSDAVNADADNSAVNPLDDQDNSTSQEQIEDDEEIEIGERKFALPKSAAETLKSERMMQADYTRKTQEVAETRKAVEAERADVARQAKTQGEYVKEMASVVAIEEQLAQYANLDWQQIIDSDPVQAMQLQQQQRALEGKRQEAQTNLAQKQQQIALDKQQSFAKQVQDAEAYMKREIPGFATGRNDELAKYAAKLGMSADATARAVIKNPVIAVALHKAELYDKLISKQAPKSPPVAAAAPAIKVGSKANVQKDPANMTDKEFAAWRAAQIRNRK